MSIQSVKPAGIFLICGEHDFCCSMSFEVRYREWGEASTTVLCKLMCCALQATVSSQNKQTATPYVHLHATDCYIKYCLCDSTGENRHTCQANPRSAPGSVEALKAKTGSMLAFPAEVMMPSTKGRIPVVKVSSSRRASGSGAAWPQATCSWPQGATVYDDAECTLSIAFKASYMHA